jgi:hypothetical protein
MAQEPPPAFGHPLNEGDKSVGRLVLQTTPTYILMKEIA